MSDPASTTPAQPAAGELLAAPPGPSASEPEPQARSKSARTRAPSKKRAAKLDPSEVRGPIEDAAARKAWRVVALYLVAVAVIVSIGLAELFAQTPLPTAPVHLGAMLVAAIVALSGVLHAFGIHSTGRLAAARALVEAELWEAAVPALKDLGDTGRTGDEATYLVAVAYDRQGARRLALESYRHYLRRHRKGQWVVEATVRVEELEALPSPAVQALAREAAAGLTCPFCHSGITEGAVTVECAGCATPHHIACYEEQAGCSVYGCASKSSRARVRE